MKLSNYIKSLESALKRHGNLEVIYAKDDEGNGYDTIFFSPSVGFFENGQFDSEDCDPNAICIN